jgi:hypothetical protein
MQENDSKRARAVKKVHEEHRLVETKEAEISRLRDSTKNLRGGVEKQKRLLAKSSYQGEFYDGLIQRPRIAILSSNFFFFSQT